VVHTPPVSEAVSSEEVKGRQKLALAPKDDPKKLRLLPHTHLAEGESTGHYHAAIGEGVELWGDEAGNLELRAPKGATVTHQEHKAQTLDAACYVVSKVVELDHSAEEVRRVRD